MRVTRTEGRYFALMRMHAHSELMESTALSDRILRIASRLERSGRLHEAARASQHALHDSASNLHAGIFLTSMGGDAASTLRVAADLRTAVPGGEKGETFTAFSDPVAGDATVAFVASTSAGRLGVYVFELASATLRLVANTATAVPGEGASAFGDFPYPPAVSGNTTVFYGAAGGAQSGIYAHRRTARGDELVAVVGRGREC